MRNSVLYSYKTETPKSEIYNIHKNNYHTNNFIYNKKKTILCKKEKILKSHRRFMMKIPCFHASRALFYGIKVLTNTDMINNTNKKDYRYLIKDIVKYSCDNNQGIPQHKNTMMQHTISQQFDSALIYDIVREQNNSIIQGIPGTYTDARFIKEIPAILRYEQEFKSLIQSITANNDSVSGNFHGQKQINQDFHCKVYDFMAKSISNTMELGTNHIIIRPHDEKAGMSMFKHTTTGSIGLLSYDKNNENIQMTSKPISHNQIHEYQRDRIDSITRTLMNDHINDININEALEKCKDIYKNTNKENPEQIYIANENIQKILFHYIECNPEYRRSISYLFTQTIDNHQCEETFQRFHEEFISRLPHRVYNFDKTADRVEIMCAAIKAYQNNYDPDIIKKITYLHNAGLITFNKNFIRDFLCTFNYPS